MSASKRGVYTNNELMSKTHVYSLDKAAQLLQYICSLLCIILPVNVLCISYCLYFSFFGGVHPISYLSVLLYILCQYCKNYYRQKKKKKFVGFNSRIPGVHAEAEVVYFF